MLYKMKFCLCFQNFEFCSFWVITRWYQNKLLLKYFSLWVSIFVVWLKITNSWIHAFMDFVFVPNKNRWFYILNMIRFHWVSKLWESFNALDRWAVELCNWKWNVDINVFIFSIFYFTYISLEPEQKQLLNFIIIDQCYFIEFEN